MDGTSETSARMALPGVAWPETRRGGGVSLVGGLLRVPVIQHQPQTCSYNQVRAGKQSVVKN